MRRMPETSRQSLGFWCGALSALAVAACGAVRNPPGQDDRPGDEPSDSGDTFDITDGDSSNTGTGECRRVVSLQGVSLETPPPFDVVIVADNSESLSWSRQDLADGLSDLVANVHGHAVRFFVLSPTQYGETSANAIDLRNGEALVRWSDPVSGVPFTGAVTNYVRACTDEHGQNLACPDGGLPNLEFELEGRWEFVMPDPVAELTSEMSEEQLDAERQKVVEAILALGISGSTDEQPLCTLTRYLKQSEVLLPERAVFLVIADEDDTNSAESCLENYEFSRYPTISTVRGYDCTNDCDAYQFWTSRVASRNSLHFSCAPTDDLGQLLPEDTWQTKTVELAASDDCSAGTSVDCSADDLETAATRCTSGDTVQRCQRTCDQDAVQEPCSVTILENLDFCSTPYTFSDTRYDNFLDFCAKTTKKQGFNGCARQGFTTESGGASWNMEGWTKPVVRANSAEDFVHLFHGEATRLFGAENYFAEAIVFTPDGPCTPAAGQSYATELMKIASSPERVYPICESYAPALEHVNDFAQGLLQTEYVLELEARESIEGITVLSRDGTKRQLLPDDYEYNPDTSVLRIHGDALLSSDLDLDVEVVDPCAPIIR